MKKSFKIIIAFLFGAIYLNFFDLLQVKFGVEISNLGWIDYIKSPLQFGLLSIGLSFLVPIFEKSFENSKIRVRKKDILFELLYFAICYLTTLVSSNSIPIFSIFLVFTYFRIIAEFKYKLGDERYFLFLMLFGPTLEILMTHLNLFSYRDKGLLGVPFWLPLLWGNGSFLMRRLFLYGKFKENIN